MSLAAHTLFSVLFPYLQSIHKITLQQAHATVANGSFNAALYLHYIGLLVICSKIKFCYKGLS